MVNELEQRFAQAIERGDLSPEEENDPEMVRLWRAHQKLEAALPSLDSVPPIIAVNREVPSEIGKYKIKRKLGAGSFGEVFEGYDEQLNRKVAVKRALVPSLRGDSFVQEARSAAKVESPYVVKVHEVLTNVRDGPCIVSDFIDGESMDLWLKEKNPDLAEKLDLFEKIARGVDAAHQKFLMHRDLKPQNVMIDQAGLPHVTDFGLAKDLDPESGATQTREDAMQGTLEYMAPEQLRGDTKSIDGRADIFALGVMLYELLTGDRPHEGDNRFEILGNIEKKLPVNPHETPGGSYLGKEKNFRDLSAICMKCVEKNLVDRYQSVAELINDLKHYRAREPVSARRITKLERARRWAMRHPAMVSIILLISVCIVLAAYWGYREIKLSAQRETASKKLTEAVITLLLNIDRTKRDEILIWHSIKSLDPYYTDIMSPPYSAGIELLNDAQMTISFYAPKIEKAVNVHWDAILSGMEGPVDAVDTSLIEKWMAYFESAIECLENESWSPQELHGQWFGGSTVIPGLQPPRSDPYFYAFSMRVRKKLLEAKLHLVQQRWPEAKGAHQALIARLKKNQKQFDRIARPEYWFRLYVGLALSEHMTGEHESAINNYRNAFEPFRHAYDSSEIMNGYNSAVCRSVIKWGDEMCAIYPNLEEVFPEEMRNAYVKQLLKSHDREVAK